MARTSDLSGNERYKVRREILLSTQWSSYKNTHKVNSNFLSNTANIVMVASSIGVNISEVIGRPFEQTETDNKTQESNDKGSNGMEPEGFEVEYKGKNKKAAAQDAAAGFIEMIASAVSIDENQVRDIVKDEVAPLYAALDQPKIVLMAEEKKVGELPATRHPMAETLLNALMVKTVDGHGLNVWIAGPAGSGKTFAVRQVAKTLGLEYGFHGAMTMPHELVGFVDAGGTYHETVFVRLYRNGGVCLLDECDAGSSEALLTLNAALANGQMSLPTGQILDRHPDFRCVAAANTFGQGATAEYVGRAKIDAAFLDRFGVRLSWGYDEKLERTMCGNPDWATYVQAARRNAVSKGIKVMITPRASMSGAALIANGMSFEDAADITFLSSLSDDQKKAIKPTGSYGSKSKSRPTRETEKIDF